MFQPVHFLTFLRSIFYSINFKEFWMKLFIWWYSFHCILLRDWNLNTFSCFQPLFICIVIFKKDCYLITRGLINQEIFIYLLVYPMFEHELASGFTHLDIVPGNNFMVYFWSLKDILHKTYFYCIVNLIPLTIVLILLSKILQ